MLKLKYINLSREKTQSQLSFVPWRSPARLVMTSLLEDNLESMPSTSISHYLDYIAGIVPRESMFELFAAGTAWLDGESGASDLIVYDISARRWLAKVKASLGSLP